MNRRGLILSVLALGVAGFGGATWFANRPGPVAEVEPVAPELADAMIRPYSPILGPSDAPVTIVEFFDPGPPTMAISIHSARVGSKGVAHNLS